MTGTGIHQQTEQQTQIVTGLRGWRHKQWRGDFYPDDIPSDWLLSFYANEFQAVLVPWDYVVHEDDSGLQDWIDQVGEEFEFFVEVPSSAHWQRVQRCLVPLQSQLSGVLLSKEEQADVANPVLLIQNLQRLCTVFINKDDFQDVLPEALLQSCAAFCSDLTLDRAPKGAGQLLLKINNDTDQDPKAIRALLDSCFSLKAGNIALFFAGETPSVSSARNAMTLIHLMA